MSGIRKLYRTILLGILLVIGIILTLIFLRNGSHPSDFASKIVSKWLGLVARTLGVRIKAYGNILPEKTLFVANHISWLDILILGNLVPVHFLSKHEVKSMPLIGWLATRAGTLYIKRGCNVSATDASSEITDALNQQHNTIVFAEGKTTNGNVRKFHSRMMQSAIDAHAMVQPVAIYYPLTNPETKEIEINPAALFFGGITTGRSFDMITRAPKIDVEVHFLKPIESSGKKRDEIAQHAYEEVVAAIELIKTKKN
ncbi:MAG: 1-acyl-sn-glycerol-3-phosphate acyltransferase [Gammaproteobacteria bacterium]|jgi:1-acyl-sn-glycerol-3-phosphate acyltransferase|nr:1-acyl-sn-glycerol-3-phosphate acyltransferase [Gammaproteobacteria bacterium]